MPKDELHDLRIVIQQLSAESHVYRVTVYGDADKPRHTDFSGAEALLQALCSALPAFDLSQLSLNPLEERCGSIVFAGAIQLDNSQLAVFGLT